MPRPDNLVEAEITLEGGYFPSVSDLSPKIYQNTINAGNNCWIRPGGKIEPAQGPLETSSTNVGARLFAADTQRASIAGDLVGNRLPYAGLLRYQNACLLYLSEETSAAVYLDETDAGVTTSSTAGRLRVAIPDGLGGYDDFDAGFDKPPLIDSDVFENAGFGVKNMQGFCGVALSRWRISTNAWGPPSDVIYKNITANTQTVLGFTLPSVSPGQDGWLVLATQWGDRSGRVRIVRYARLQPRGTFTATNGSPNLTGVNTFWTQDLGRKDLVQIDGAFYDILTNPTDGTATLATNFTGSTGSGKTMTLIGIRAEWFDGDLRDVVDTNIQRPLRAAGITQWAGRVILWGIPDTETAISSDPTGNGFAVMLDNNPEHIGLLGRVTASGSNLVNVLAGDGPLYFMTTTSLEIIERVSTGDQPFVPRVISAPGFKAATNGCLVEDRFYGFTNRPIRTVAEDNIDTQFAAPVTDDMADWDGERVIVAPDPDKKAVLYIFDNGSTTTVRAWMEQQGVWGPPINLSARILDAQVVNGKLYITYLDGGDIHVNEWEGGGGLSGAYVATQYLDPNLLNSNRLKRLAVAGKLGSLSVYAVEPDVEIPDVTDLDQAAVDFPLSDVNMREADIRTNIAGDAFAFRFNFSSGDGSFQKLVVGGLPRSR